MSDNSSWSGIPRKRRYFDYHYHKWVEVNTIDCGRQDSKRIVLPQHRIYNRPTTDDKQRIVEYLQSHGRATVSELSGELGMDSRRVSDVLEDDEGKTFSPVGEMKRHTRTLKIWGLVRPFGLRPY